MTQRKTPADLKAPAADSKPPVRRAPAKSARIVSWHLIVIAKRCVIFIERAMGGARKESHTSQVPEFSLRLSLLVTSFPARMSDSNWSSLAAALFNAC
jgi:hypothetical protein